MEKNRTCLLLIATFALLMASCSSGEGNARKDRVRVLMKNGNVENTPQRMPANEIKTTFDYKGKSYTSVVTCTPDDSQPLVKNQQGDTFVDNSISLRLTSGGKTVLDRTFTKADFAMLVDALFLKHAILEGLAFDETTSAGIVYAASVNYPQSDFYVPIRITVMPDGKVRMDKEEVLEDYEGTEQE